MKGPQACFGASKIAQDSAQEPIVVHREYELRVDRMFLFPRYTCCPGWRASSEHFCSAFFLHAVLVSCSGQRPSLTRIGDDEAELVWQCDVVRRRLKLISMTLSFPSSLPGAV